MKITRFVNGKRTNKLLEGEGSVGNPEIARVIYQVNKRLSLENFLTSGVRDKDE